jgi:hypothetical protein
MKKNDTSDYSNDDNWNYYIITNQVHISNYNIDNSSNDNYQN